MTDLGDFNSYDLSRVLEALRAALAEYPDQPAGPALRRSFVQLVSWDHRHRVCWDDNGFLARYAWMRETLAIDSNPTLAGTIDALAPLVDQLAALDAQSDDEPF